MARKRGWFASTSMPWRDVDFAEYSANATAWKFRQLVGEDFSVTPLEAAWGFFAKVDGVLLRYIG